MVFSSSTRLRFALALGQNFERDELRQLKERCFIFFRRNSTVVLNVGGGTIFAIADEDLFPPPVWSCNVAPHNIWGRSFQNSTRRGDVESTTKGVSGQLGFGQSVYMRTDCKWALHSSPGCRVVKEVCVAVVV